MPSCVVTSCRNNTTDQSKQKGITFHKFPKDISWKNKWIRVIREWRNQPEWLPSKFSVVCSAHFAEANMYTTRNGNRKVKLQKAPTLKLYENTPARRTRSEINSANEHYSRSVQTNAGPADDREAYNKMATDDQQSCGRDQYSGEQIEKFIIKVEPRESVETCVIDTQTNDLGENLIIKEEPKEELALEISIDPLAKQHNAENCANVVPDPSYYEQKLKVITAQLNEFRRKTKILLEKLNRSQKRNLKMKNILKAIKLRKLIDRDVFRELTASLFENND